MKVQLPELPKSKEWGNGDIIIFDGKAYMVMFSYSLTKYFLVELETGTAWYTGVSSTLEHLQNTVEAEKNIQAHLPSSKYELKIVSSDFIF